MRYILGAFVLLLCPQLTFRRNWGLSLSSTGFIVRIARRLDAMLTALSNNVANVRLAATTSTVPAQRGVHFRIRFRVTGGTGFGFAFVSRYRLANSMPGRRLINYSISRPYAAP